MRAFAAAALACVFAVRAAVGEPAPGAGEAAPAAPPAARPEAWAVPVALEGVPNLHKVSDVLYRSAQPTAEGMRALKGLGIKTVVNLRTFHSDRDEIGAAGLDSESIPMQAWRPERQELVRFLKIVSDPDRAPVLVHCQHGADRTGALCALYRVVIQGWSKEEALREMAEGGYGFHEVWQNLLDWVGELDIEAVRKDVGAGADMDGAGELGE